MTKYANGKIEKGQMKNNNRHGTWDIYYPIEQNNSGEWSKQAYDE